MPRSAKVEKTKDLKHGEVVAVLREFKSLALI